MKYFVRYSFFITPVLLFLTPSLVAADNALDFAARLAPVPATAKLSDENSYVWGGSMVRDEEELCHLFYSRWPRS